jgi:hypothetical protein
MMTCEVVQEELVAYLDGELSEPDRVQIAAHLQTCAACAREEAQLSQLTRLLVKMERFEPSPEFATNFWKRLEQEAIPVKAEANKPPTLESRFGQWWKSLQELFSAWQLAPAFAAAASVIVFLGYFLISPSTQQKIEAPKQPSSPVAAAEAPSELREKLGLFVNYNVIAELERFSRFDEIAAIQLPTEHDIETAKEDEVPPEVLQNPSFFAHYPILRKMEQLKNLEAVLDRPTRNDKKNQG